MTEMTHAAETAAAERVEQLVDRYIAIWNAADAEQRRDLITRTMTDDATYVDPVMSGVGHDGIDAMLTAVQAQFPGARLALAGGIDAHHDRVRFSWTLTAADSPSPIAKGIDFAVVSNDGRFQSITGFIDYLATR